MMQAMPKYIIEATSVTGLILVIIAEVLHEVDLVNLIPQISVFAVAAFRLLPSISKISAHITTILYYKPSVDLVCQDLNEISGFEYRSEAGAGKEIYFNNCIQIKSLEFYYPNTEKKIVNGVNFCINKGEAVAFVGKSGAGKSTIVDLILGVLEPTQGEILVDNENICDNKLSWYDKIGYVSQNIFLMDSSILNNIAFGVSNENIDMEKVLSAVKLSQLDTFVDSLENGIYTVIGEDGARISGGQKQRIGIARALYNNPDILVFDEATSALDQETEKAVLESIEGLYKKKTMIIIAHRLNTVKKCDKIYEIIDGNIVQRTLDENLNLC